ncbi:glycoside hydrolase family 13 protein [Pseudonocardia humida]|uniref:Glycoside hydrolase family 13 protein n=1 Tax=Pseudonocardia humida TaxID=2800819 RepID=A0ABT0ZWJ0_9PSEU|nr:glycoside hydrolase family 13 protein [Pseudonocardia humida]MCO1655112.1 glycoside hydrolase family 13 protein [Pseudonocardia humida]
MENTTWWRSAVVYQVYIRSFADGDGDGLGDVAGIRARLPHIAGLGVDAVWINPWYPSPMADAGYDVSDYRDVEPRFGTLAEAEALIAEAHGHGLRVLLDIVPNHTSDEHEWFQEALAAGPGSPARERYLFRPGRGDDGELPPNDWRSMFGGPAWTRATDPDGTPGEWYLHLFDTKQPDVNWEHPDVRADFLQTLRFWFDRGVDGFRIDVANSLIKQPGLPDIGDLVYPPPQVEVDGELVRAPYTPHPHWDRDEVHEVYREWRELADSYDPPRVFVAEAWVDHPDRLSRYVRRDELHTAFNFNYLVTPWRGPEMRKSISETIAEHAAVGAPPTWVLSNHDVSRHPSRYARVDQTAPTRHLDPRDTGVDHALGLRRARAAALLTLALPGGAYVYQGEELGLPEVEDLPEDVLQDPTWERSGRTERGRDGCRVPIPWSGDTPPYGFGPGSTTWLPQPADWGPLTVEAQAGDPSSVLELYRAALRLRREHPALGDGTLRFRDDFDADVVAFDREPGFTCVVNMGPNAVRVPAGEVLLSSIDLPDDGTLPSDAAVWLSR